MIQRAAVFILLLTASLAVSARDLPLDKIKLPPGFKISLYADNVPGARSMALSPGGTLFVGTRGSKIYALPNRSLGKRAEQAIVLADDLDTPNGVAFRDGALYVAEVNRILRFDAIESRLRNPPRPVVVNDRFPTDNQHGWKF
ncbi:MAG: sorbosone dehydrogenase family protein, partial [Gallionella sp.]|nr:sorbosone dehydrogenase family protein [Gallionella sp.]